MGGFLLPKSSVSAQTGELIDFSVPDLTGYPDISIRFRVFDNSGVFTKNLDLSSVHVLENNQVIAPDTLELLEPGVRLIVAINEGPTLANRYAQVTRIDKVKESLSTWAEAQSITTMDDFSLVSNSGIEAASQTKPSDWLEVIQNYQPDMRKAQPGLTSLSSAIDLAIVTSDDADKTSALLYLTPLPTEDQIAGLEDLISRAKLGGVRLFIWLAGPQSYAAKDQAELLKQAAEETGR